MKECELCNCRAKMYCESDQASLCCGCDAKVHSANFLVARHTRTLLCHKCQSPTPWKASGPSFGPTVSVCNRCCAQRPEMQHHHQQKEGEEEEEEEEGDGENEEEEEDDDDVEDEDEDEGIDEEEDGENQVVPWSATPPPLPSSSGSEGEEDSSSSVGRSTDRSAKRTRENANLSYQDDLGCTSPTSRQREEEEEEEEETTTSSIACLRPLKRKGTVGSDSRSALIGSLQRFHKACGDAGDGDVIEICKLSGEGRAVDQVDTDSPGPLI